MNKIISALLKCSALYLFAIGVFFLLRNQIYPDYKLGRLPWGIAFLMILIASIPALALYFSPDVWKHKLIYKILIALALLSPLLISTFNSYDFYLRLYYDRYREGFLYIATMTIGSLSCLLGYIAIIRGSRKIA